MKLYINKYNYINKNRNSNKYQYVFLKCVFLMVKMIPNEICNISENVHNWFVIKQTS